MEGPARLYNWTASATGLALESFTQSLSFGILSNVIVTIAGLPLQYYSNFVVEAKHGFNKMTVKDFFLDNAKALVLRVVLLHPLQTGVIQWVVRRFGAQFPLYFFVTMAALMTVFMLITPTIIQPMFNKFTDLEKNTRLYGKIKALADRVNFPLNKVYAMDGSRRSNHSNAWTGGIWKYRRIVLYDTLIE